MKNCFWLSVLIWLLSLSGANAQTDSSFVYIRGRLLNAKTSEAVPFAHILLSDKLKGMISDIDGYFDSYFGVNDTLTITSIGYEDYHVSINELKSDSSVNLISLTPKIYMLNEVKITQYPTYEKLKEIITNPVFSEEEKKILRVYQHMEETGLKRIARESGKKGATGPISALYNLFSRDRNNYRKYEELKTEDQKEAIRHKRMSDSIISRLTGLTDSLTIGRFVRFCNFGEHFLNNSSEYELYTLILEKFKIFRQMD